MGTKLKFPANSIGPFAETWSNEISASCQAFGVCPVVVISLNLQIGLFFFSEDGRLLGEAIATQKTTRYGGVIPSFAMGFHAEALPRITRDALIQVI